MPAPNLADLDLFLAVARHRSFRRAAKERGVAPSTLSLALKRLEEDLGVRLLNRTTRSVTPTEAGQRLVARLAPIFTEVAESLDEVNSFRDTPTGLLRLNVPVVVSWLILAPLVPRFLAAYPGITLEIIDNNALIDVFAEGFDAGIRYGEALAQDVVAVPISPPQRYVLAGSPDLIAREGLPQHPRDLVGRPCIRHRFADSAAQPWEFERNGEVVRVMVDGPLIANSVHIGISAAESGLGWYCTFEGFLAPSLAAGRLVPALEDWLPPFPGPYLYYPSRRHVPAPLRAFIDFMKRHYDTNGI
ncbi:DNA-binding transcriptional LysR family regulator [Nitrospirillum iridis]|uniref:DNA-binding transcriptional LysR family regulator n=2 Tax=Nitrospirillum iridis TaxID=765888 RepID=A0A7X0ATG2_9PROT|nr:LysR family transcriptional regulator [Nitrospirillum iridis]MBB6249802.1 DNA-binding transcriptional LysR family regulator [Nitrospirillum iridis]